MTSNRQERSERTRERLLDATVESLIEIGYARTSMQEVCTRAELSRGAQLHHFPTKAGLMAAAIAHLTRKQTERVLAVGENLPEGPGRMAALIDLMWEGFSGPLAKASIELWVACANDPELRAVMLPVDRTLAHATLELCRKYSGGADPKVVETIGWLTIDLHRGIAVDELLGGDPKRRAHLLETWKLMAVAALDA
ncbi:TetR family transcriptional regulator [Longispora fulva]|uniref:AcrR family transcriptional regulator n=1 Tax=Longispora fulva TaxID=619741 RepID=A0A8J7GFJ5_9ACTN|nr:TetR/AcrR family transcriptional regulator [Longispora fulva]MBG6137934.1 AcrR family transcriptional regulator [Longispora fulva]GIG60187.1 TetR family transcriptional regulator [Longispora fulva]